MLSTIHDELLAQGFPVVSIYDRNGELSVELEEGATEEEQEFCDTYMQSWEPTAAPDWTGLMQDFQYPGNTLYASIVGKVAGTGFTVQDHWANLKMLISTAALQNVGALAAGISHLATLLDEVDLPLADSDISAWNDLMDEHHFPNGCKL